MEESKYCKTFFYGFSIKRKLTSVIGISCAWNASTKLSNKNEISPSLIQYIIKVVIKNSNAFQIETNI